MTIMAIVFLSVFVT